MLIRVDMKLFPDRPHNFPPHTPPVRSDMFLPDTESYPLTALDKNNLPDTIQLLSLSDNTTLLNNQYNPKVLIFQLFPDMYQLDTLSAHRNLSGNNGQSDNQPLLLLSDSIFLPDMPHNVFPNIRPYLFDMFLSDKSSVQYFLPDNNVQSDRQLQLPLSDSNNLADMLNNVFPNIRLLMLCMYQPDKLSVYRYLLHNNVLLDK